MVHLPSAEYELIKKMQQAKTQAEHDQLEKELEAILAKKNKKENSFFD